MHIVIDWLEDGSRLVTVRLRSVTFFSTTGLPPIPGVPDKILYPQSLGEAADLFDLNEDFDRRRFRLDRLVATIGVPAGFHISILLNS